MTIVDVDNSEECQEQKERNLFNDCLVIEQSLQEIRFCFFVLVIGFHNQFLLYIFSATRSLALRALEFFLISSFVATIGFLFTGFKTFFRSVVANGFSS